MKQALNATFFGMKLSSSNSTITTILWIAEAVVCILFAVLVIYILCEKKRAATIQKEMTKLAKKEAAAKRTKGSADLIITQIGSDGIKTQFCTDGKMTTEIGAEGITTKVGSDGYITTRIGADGQMTNTNTDERELYPASFARTEK